MSKGGGSECGISTFIWVVLRKGTSGDNYIEHVLAKADIEHVWVSVYTFKDIVMVYRKKCQIFVRL